MMVQPRSVPSRAKIADRMSLHCRRVSTIAPFTALAKLAPTLPRGVVGPLVASVAGSTIPLSLFKAAWVTRDSSKSRVLFSQVKDL